MEESIVKQEEKMKPESSNESYTQILIQQEAKGFSKILVKLSVGIFCHTVQLAGSSWEEVTVWSHSAVH